ncbi:DUF302 domain-containing protein [Flavobacterium cerinum]|uniref:DUF302 domain-containing protein n=1 Tax=Flavobacterium cerinum TaxID=2502784 RepID=A0ABY5IZM0_9FLAO|nr:DUF302 domain-containing protein [Flavobacterium cerinum]UUC47178.1 DUF302 domain-containing protein [Flavobacterium cerinum]
MDSLYQKKSNSDFYTTEQHLKKELELQHIHIFSATDHSKNASDIGIKMNPSKVFILGNAKAGTPLMLEDPLIAIELPLKILLVEDDKKQVWVYYKNLHPLKNTYSIQKSADQLTMIDTKMHHIIESVCQ